MIEDNELSFVQIAAVKECSDSYKLFGLTKEGKVYRYKNSIGKWAAIPMKENEK